MSFTLKRLGAESLVAEQGGWTDETEKCGERSGAFRRTQKIGRSNRPGGADAVKDCSATVGCSGLERPGEDECVQRT